MLRKTLLGARIINKGNYKYIFHPISDGIPRLSSKLLREVIEGLYKIIDVGCVYGKQGGRQKVLKKTGINVKTLMDVNVSSEDKVIEI